VTQKNKNEFCYLQERQLLKSLVGGGFLTYGKSCMDKMKPPWLSIVVIFALTVSMCFVLPVQKAHAAACTFTSQATGNWSAAGTWTAVGTGCSTYPGQTYAGDTVTIATGNTVTLDVSPANAIGALAINTQAAAGTNGLTIGANTLTVVSISLTGSGTAGQFSTVSISTGTINITGNITFSGTAAQALLTFTGAGTLNIGGNFGSGGTLTTGGNGTIKFNGSAAQTIGTYTTFNNVEIANTSGGVTLTGTTTFGGTLVVDDGATFTVDAYTLTVTGTTTVGNGASGILSITSTTGAKTFTGAVTINNGGTLTETVAEALIFGSNVTNYGTLTEFGAATIGIAGSFTNNGTYIASTGTHTFSGATQTIGGTGAISIPTATFTGAYTNTGTLISVTLLTVTGTTLTNNGTITASTALSGTGGVTQGTTGILNIGGTSGITTLTATAAGNTVNYTGAAQTVKSNNYYNLTLSGSGTDVMQAGTTAIGGNFTLIGTVTTTTAANLAITGNLLIGDGTSLTVGAFTLSVGGTTTVGNGNSGTLSITSATGTKTFTGAVTIDSGGNMTETAAATLSFGSDVNIYGTLTESGAATVGIAGSFTNNGAYTASTGTHTFSGATKTISGSSITSIPTATFSGTYTNSGTLSSATALTMTGNFTNNGTITATTLLTVTGAAITLTNNGTITASTALSGTGGVTQGTTGTLNIGGTSSITTLANSGIVTITGAGAISTVVANFTNTGTLNLDGTGTIAGITNSTGGIINLTSSGTITSLNNATATSTLNISAAPVPAITTLTATATGNTVNYNGAAQTVIVTTYYNLNLSGSGAMTFAVTTINGNLTLSGTCTATTGAALAIGGNLDVGSGTTFATGATNTWTLGVTGTTSVEGTLTLANTGAKTFTGNVTVNTGGVWSETGAAAVNFAGSLTNNATTFTASTGTHTFSGATQTLSGSTATTIPTVTFSTGSSYTNNGTLTVATLLTVTGTGVLTNNGTITATTALSGTGGVTQGTTGILNIGGTSGITTLTATAVGNTVNYTGAAQTVKATTYDKLILSGSGVKTIGVVTVNDLLSMEGTATASAAPTYGTAATLQYNKPAAFTTGAEFPATFSGTGGVIITNTGTITLSAAKTITYNLAIDSGASLNLNTFTTSSANALTLGGSGQASGTWGGTGSGAANINTTYFAAATGRITIAASSGTYSISGTVFEDINYGGGAGRSLANSSGVGIAGVRVELYNSAGGFLSSTTTNASGVYTFSPSSGNYIVRVSSNGATGIRSTRANGSTCTTCVPVQTYRTNASSGTAAAVTDHVGGQTPTLVDAGDNTTSSTLASLTTGTTTAQSITSVTIGAANITGVDFGFNFDTIVSIRDSSQGSLRQFITNANALGGQGSLTQVGQTAGQETSIFMIPNGTANPGQNTGYADQLTTSGANTGAAVITLTSGALPTISSANVSLDATTQTTNVGDTNPGMVGTGGTVGTMAQSLSQFNRPEVVILAEATQLSATGTTDIIKGLAVANGGIIVSGSNSQVRECLAGMNADGSVTTIYSATYGITIGAGTGILIHHNYAKINNSGIRGDTTGANAIIEYNEVDSPAGTPGGGQTDTFDGILIVGTATGITIQYNLVKDMHGGGLEFGFAGGTVISGTAIGNTITANGFNSTGIPSTEPIGIVAWELSATSALTIRQNLVTGNAGPGVTVISSTGVTITQNSIFANGSLAADIGIDLNSISGDPNTYTAQGVTLNTAGCTHTGPNNELNFPIIQSAILSTGNLILRGWACPGSAIEFFIAAPDASGGFGSGKTYLTTLTEGSAADTDNTSSTYGPGAINGLLQGTDTTNRYMFTIPVPAGVAIGTVLTATETLSGNTSEFSGEATVVGGPNLFILKSVNNASANPGGVLTYTVQVKNTGTGPANAVTLTDSLGNYNALRISAYSGSPFNFTDGNPSSGLTLGTPIYSNNGGSTWTYTLTSGGGGAPAGYDGNVTNWQIPMTGTMNGNGGNFTLNYMSIVK